MRVERAPSTDNLARCVALCGAPIALAFALATGCRARVPGPELEPRVDVALGSCVPYPPPVTRLDDVAARPDSVSVWVPGEWRWNGRGYVWQPGAWAVPPADAVFARATSMRLSNGALVHFRGHWHPRAPVDGGVDLDVAFHCAAPIPIAGSAQVVFVGGEAMTFETGADGVETASSILTTDASLEVTVDVNDENASGFDAVSDKNATLEIVQPPP